MTVVVTGASGHVGANLIRTLLAQGRTVRGLVHQDTRAIAGLNIHTIKGDVCDPDSLNRAFTGASTVFHLAASISLMTGRRQATERINIQGTRNVVAACLRSNVKKLVHFSSIHVISYAASPGIVDESCPLVGDENGSPYNRSKAVAEGEVLKGIEQGLNAVIVRPTAIIGPYDYYPSHFGEVLLSLSRGRLPALVRGGFDWVDVRDVVTGAIRAEECAPSGAKYLLSGHWATFCEVADIVAGITGRRLPRLVCPLWLAGLGAPVATAFEQVRGKRPLFTSFAIRTLKESHRVDHDKATRELGYEPRPLRETIEDTLRWFKESGHSAK
jgi:dihydroflavonol-4-reductase